MLKIGNLTLKSRLLLAPIAGHCDLPFRLVARSCGGVGIAYTDLLCPHGILKQNEQTRWLMATRPEDQPLGMQLYGQDIDLMTEAARWAEGHGAQVIDINMGCPVDKVTKTFAGSMMLCTPDHTLEVARRLVETVNVPVTAKLRLGWAEDELSAPSLAARLVEVGVAAITIHGRTAAKRFKGTVDLEGIAAVVDAVHAAGGGNGGGVPCIGNGDVKTPFDAVAMVEKTGCDGVMIARAALGAPWIFRDADALIEHGAIGPEMTLRQRLECVKMHYGLLLEMREERRAVNRMKQIIHGYGTHLGPCKSLKAKVRAMTIEEPEVFEGLVDGFLDEMGEKADEVPVTWAERVRQLEDAKRTPNPGDKSVTPEVKTG